MTKGNSLPTTAEFEQLVTSLRPPPRDGSAKFVDVVPVEPVEDAGVSRVEAAIQVAYNADARLGIEALVTRTQSALQTRGHPADRPIVLALIGLFAYSRVPGGARGVEAFNRMLDAVCTADLNEYFVSALPWPSSKRCVVGDFTIGEFDFGRLARQSKAAGSDYAERYKDLLARPRFAIVRKPVRVTVIDFRSVCEGVVAESSAWVPLMEIVARYFTFVSQVHFDEMPAALDATLQVARALGAFDLDVRGFLMFYRADRIAVYLNMPGGLGFVAPLVTKPVWGTQLPVEQLPQALAYLEANDAPTLVSSCHEADAYFRFVALARRDHLHRRLDDTFLHAVIALDVLFGDTGAAAQSVAERAAMLLHQARNESFDTTRKRLKSFYDARSRYVHSGERAPSELLDDLLGICREIGFCVLRAHRASLRPHGNAWHQQWINEIDVCVALLRAGRTPSDSDLRRIGSRSSEQPSATAFDSLLVDASRAEG